MRSRILPALFVALMGVASETHAAFTITFDQVGSNVLATGTGSLNTTGLTASAPYTAQAGVFAATKFAAIGPAPSQAPSAVTYRAFFNVGSPVFGPGDRMSTRPDTGTGDFAGFEGDVAIFTSPGYVSGSAIFATSTYNNQTLASLELARGTYTYIYSATAGGPELDRIIVRIGLGGAVPEPASIAMVGLGLAGVGLVARRRTKG